MSSSSSQPTNSQSGVAHPFVTSRKRAREALAQRGPERAGPSTLQQVLDWPDRAWHLIFNGDGGVDRMLNLKRHIRHGINLHTQYSGKGTAEICFQHIKEKIENAGLAMAADLRWKACTAFDKKISAIEVLQNHKSGGACCIFGDFESCMAPAARAHLQTMLPDKDSTLVERQRAYRQLGRWLGENVREVFKDDQRATCYKHASDHEGGCMVWRRCLEGSDRRDSKTIDIWCAGQVCKDVSRRGLMEGFAGPYTRSYKVWVGMVRARRPRVWIHEITVSHLAEKELRQDLEDLYNIKTMMSLSPSMIGIPVSRDRMYSIGTLRGVVVNSGSWEEFLRVCGSKCELSGDIFFRAPARHRREVCRLAAQKRGWYYNDSDDRMPMLSEFLTPAEVRRLNDYSQKFADKNGMPVEPNQPINAFFTCDVLQNVTHGTVSGNIPCLTSSGKIMANWPTGEQAMAVGLEHLLMMGDAWLCWGGSRDSDWWPSLCFVVPGRRGSFWAGQHAGA